MADKHEQAEEMRDEVASTIARATPGPAGAERPHRRPTRAMVRKPPPSGFRRRPTG